MNYRQARLIFEDILVGMVNNIWPWRIADSIPSAKESLDILIRSRKSIIRWGDGESNICVGDDIYFQGYHPELRRRLLHILKEYRRFSPEYYMTMTESALLFSRKQLEAKGKYRAWRRTRYVVLTRCSLKRTYLNHYLFKGLGGEGGGRVSALWSDAEQVLVIHPKPDIVKKYGIESVNRKVDYIEIPEKNVFDIYPSLYTEVRVRMTAMGMIQNPEASRVLITAGPVAKLLVKDISDMGVRAYDMGKYFSTEMKWLNDENNTQ